MKERIQLDSYIFINLSEEGNGVRAISEYTNTILPGRQVDSIRNIVVENFSVVKKHYIELIDDNSGLEKDISIVCLKLVMQYLYMYNMWEESIQKEKVR